MSFSSNVVSCCAWNLFHYWMACNGPKIPLRCEKMGKMFEVGMAAFGSRTIWGDDFTQAITIKLNNIISDKNAHIKVLQIKSTKRSKLYLLPVATSG